LSSEVEEDGDADEDLDDVELLGLGGDKTEEEVSDGRMDIDGLTNLTPHCSIR
jgi:hypothetical protein